MNKNITYLKAGPYRIPALHIPEQKPLNRYGRMRKQFLKDHKPNLYTQMMLSGELMEHLHSIGEMTERQVTEQMQEIQQKLAEKKPQGDLNRIQNMQKILSARGVCSRRQAEEMVFPETIFA